MYDELIKRLRDAAKMSDALAVLLPHSEGNAVAKLHRDAADAIEELSCENESLAKSVNEASEILRRRWIPVTERLPLHGDAVLCFGDNGISLADFVCGDKWRALPWFYVDGEQETGVTHWMPLPEPPKEE